MISRDPAAGLASWVRTSDTWDLRRDYLWEGHSLLAEGGFALARNDLHWSELDPFQPRDPPQQDYTLLWRKTYVPGASGLGAQERRPVRPRPQPNHAGGSGRGRRQADRRGRGLPHGHSLMPARRRGA